MVDIDKLQLPLECERCGFVNDVFIRQVRLGDIVICRGCKINIHLRREKGALVKLKRAFEALQQAIEGFDLDIAIEI